ncbi:kinase [Halobacillus salinarum]|uniref:Kinase n=1 Tax=Halobacillus salinarum TaxID=2932257 RepID=A0ABY4EPQ9_9BACI|nr:kinase [Halobacillus salinarum]UOQ46432.1 kinase [Halobacillus salinarum]
MNEYAGTLYKSWTERGKSRFIIAVDGLSRSGKTTLAVELYDHLKEAVNVIVFHMDDFIEERSRRYQTGHEQWYEYYQLQWDTEWLRDHFLSELKSADALTLPVYNPLSDSHILETYNLSENDIVIVEGVFLQRKEWRSCFDYIVYLDCPRKVRFSRESKETRLQIDKFKNRYWKGEDIYLEKEEPLVRADLVIHG